MQGHRPVTTRGVLRLATSRTLSRFAPSTRLHAGLYWPRQRIFAGPRFLGRTGRCGVEGNANTPAIADEGAASGRGLIPLVVGNGISSSCRELLVWLCGQPCRPLRSSCDVAP